MPLSNAAQTGPPRRPRARSVTAAAAPGAAARGAAAGCASAEWVQRFDSVGWKRDVRALAEELRAEEGPADVEHLQRIVLLTQVLLLLGTALLPLPTWTLLPVVLLAYSNTVAWACVAHHAQHGGYMRCDPTGQYHRGRFGIGLARRVCDWLDWMLPEAWDEEHNRLHHYHTNEDKDPDFLEQNFRPGGTFDTLPLPRWGKAALIFIIALSWKWIYYASNTWKTLMVKEAGGVRKLSATELKIIGSQAQLPLMLYEVIPGYCPRFLRPIEFMARVMAPYFLIRMILPVLAWGLLAGEWAAWNAAGNIAAAEVLANLHSFIIIGPNHTGSDLYAFDHAVAPLSSEFFLRQALSSVNFHIGSDLAEAGWGPWAQDACDLTHGWLNYQIEHHLFPNLSMLGYRRAAPRVRELCRKYDVPYAQENVFTRVGKLVHVLMGDEVMQRFPGLPSP